MENERQLRDIAGHLVDDAKFQEEMSKEKLKKPTTHKVSGRLKKKPTNHKDPE